MTTQTENKIVHFLRELLHPEGFGWAVTHEVRKEAYQLLIMIEGDSNNEQDSTVRQTTRNV
jgi:hypothetical protein